MSVDAEGPADLGGLFSRCSCQVCSVVSVRLNDSLMYLFSDGRGSGVVPAVKPSSIPSR